MKLNVVQGVIDRRILANYLVDPAALARILPPPFRPKLFAGAGIAGICLIRLKAIRPQFVPGEMGLSSENAAHRIAVEWTTDGVTREGVYIPRRDSSSKLSTWVGGRLFPGVHHHARFDIRERGDCYHVALDSDDGQTHVCIEARVSTQLPLTSIFGSLSAASGFFEAGSVGYSAARRAGVYDGLELRTRQWQVAPLAVERIESSFFENEALFPKDTVQFDCALLMRGIAHEWHGQEALCCPTAD